MPVDTSRPSLEQDAELFIQEEDDLEETLELPMLKQPTRPPVELKNPSGWPSLCLSER